MIEQKGRRKERKEKIEGRGKENDKIDKKEW